MENRPYDILKLPTGGKLYKNKIDTLSVNHLKTFEEDILCSPSLISSGEVWKVLYNMLVREKMDLAWDDLYFIDRFAFMLQVRIMTYGADVEYELKNPSTNEIEKYTFMLDKIELPSPDYNSMDDNMLYQYKLPTSGKLVKFKLLNAKESDDVITESRAFSSKLGLPYNQDIKFKLKACIVSIDGENDKSAIERFLDSNEMTIKDSFNLRKEINAKVPEPDLTQEVTTNKGNKFVKGLEISSTFFFPALYL